GGRDDVVGGVDLLLVQDRDGGGGLQRGHHAAADGDLPVGGGQGGVDGAHGLAGQQADPGGGGVGVGAGQAGRLPDAAGDVVGGGDGHHRQAEGVAQADEAGRLDGAVVAELFAGGHHAHRLASHGGQGGVDVFAKAGVQLHGAAGVGHGGGRLGGGLPGLEGGGGGLEIKAGGSAQVVGRQQARHMGGGLGRFGSRSSHDGGHTGLGGGGGRAGPLDLIAPGSRGEGRGEEQLGPLGHDADVGVGRGQRAGAAADAQD